MIQQYIIYIIIMLPLKSSLTFPHILWLPFTAVGFTVKTFKGHFVQIFVHLAFTEFLVSFL